MSEVPKARRLILAIAEDLIVLAEELRKMEATILRREYIVKRGPTRATHITPALAKKVIHFMKLNPNMLHREVGEHFGFDGGRCSDILRGKYNGSGKTTSRR